jgi:DnaJ family protein C protein 3
MEKWCDELLKLNGYTDDVDGLVGHGEALLMKEEWETVRIFDRAFEASRRGDRDVSYSIYLFRLMPNDWRMLIDC